MKLKVMLKQNVKLKMKLKVIQKRNVKLNNEAKGETKAKSEAKKNILNGDEQRILELVKRNPIMSQTAIANETGFSRSKVQRIMKNFQEESIVSREGGRKGGSWKVLGE